MRLKFTYSFTVRIHCQRNSVAMSPKTLTVDPETPNKKTPELRCCGSRRARRSTKDRLVVSWSRRWGASIAPTTLTTAPQRRPAFLRGGGFARRSCGASQEGLVWFSSTSNSKTVLEACPLVGGVVRLLEEGPRPVCLKRWA